MKRRIKESENGQKPTKEILKKTFTENIDQCDQNQNVDVNDTMDKDSVFKSDRLDSVPAGDIRANTVYS